MKKYLLLSIVLLFPVLIKNPGKYCTEVNPVKFTTTVERASNNKATELARSKFCNTWKAYKSQLY